MLPGAFKKEYSGVFSAGAGNDLPDFDGNPCDMGAWQGFVSKHRPMKEKSKTVTPAEALEMFQRGDNLSKLRYVIERVLKGSGFGKHATVDWQYPGCGGLLLSLSVRFRQQTLVVEQKIPLNELLVPPAARTRAKHIQIVYGQMLRDLLNTVETQIV